ncbi:c-type cytochrome [Geomonas subterranea]|uniref:C-type cytochrome n=1 Tax=Geomonas subterranea TaxID=2847989 RepID=A0ABX8LCA0_9BACT|nr:MULTISPECIES: c-type cytochrome [Geomonas]QXE89647.1 c-type cytochrome [Geomonas subterranea]QXM08238.1 c-type cytochrome [Geomonas subterranea]
MPLPPPLPGRHIAACLAACLGMAALLGGCTESQKTGSPPVASERGAQLFKVRCAPCHPDGGNVINPRKTLHGGVLADNGIASPSGIMNRMRNPGPGMTRFDQGTIPDSDARLIAEYILATYR